MYTFTQERYCSGCGCEIYICAYISGGETYCCEDCFHHIPCHCGELHELEDDHQTTQSPFPLSGLMVLISG